MTNIKTTQHFKLEFFDKYVIVEGITGAIVDREIAQMTLKSIMDHYDGKNFTIISNRVNEYILDLDAYSSKILKKVKSFAVVSTNPKVKERALLEQDKYDHAFAFFSCIEEAKNWAESFN